MQDFRPVTSRASPSAPGSRAGNLLSGNGELLDASLFCLAEAGDATRFFEQVVWPLGRLQSGEIDLSSDTAAEILDAFTRRYAAEDLVQGLPTTRLLPEIIKLINPELEARGIRLLDVPVLSFRRASDRALVAEQAQEISARVRDVELDGVMDELEKQAMFEDFARQLDPELVRLAGVRFSAASAAPETAPAPVSGTKLPSRLESLLAWLRTEAEAVLPPWRLDALWKKQPERPQPTPRSLPKNWWIPRAVWIVLLVLLGYLLTRWVVGFSVQSGWSSPWGLILMVWAIVLGGIIESMKALLEKRERLLEAPHTLTNSASLKDLAGKDRLKIDQIVRKQASTDLLSVRETLNELRGKIYRAGNEDLALQVRALEGRFDQATERILRTDLNPAAYLEELLVDRAAFSRMLTSDEELLARSAALSEEAHALQQAFLADQLDPASLKRLESNLETFTHNFEQRSRSIQPALQG